MNESIITRDRMIPPLLVADPAIGSIWTQFLQHYSENLEDLPYYLFLADVARYLDDQLRLGRTDHFNDVFEIIELWISKGDEYVQEAAVVGLLEDLQNNVTKHPDGKLSDFDPWLGEQTRRYWQKVIDFWETGKIISYE